jgi:hypothetical protein
MKNNLYQNQISRNHGIGQELLQKNEFVFLSQYFFTNEVLDSLMVVQTEEQLSLAAFTNQRLFLVFQGDTGFYRMKRYGLEEIVDVQLKPYLGDAMQLVILLQNKKRLFLEGVNDRKAKHFGANLVHEIQA